MEPDDDVLDEEVLDELVEAAGSFLPESPDGFEDVVVVDVVVDELDERLSVR
ncbi:hypothetical protein Msi02_81630 [Microbispora siamensis]|uniref:Uncharacterized protein n=1 Tax=Microbispora siamensis TaxID=564413 RepID=A0ABQ4H0Y9_9ACTN|nr:hypothetical protein [Microbispora siamensis]GIH67346.1 hypothetical protein Msi02_81630 [Microbispora siamensis]